VKTRLEGPELVRAVWVLATSRGLISPDEAWDAAARWGQGQARSVWKTFEGFLTSKQVAALADEAQENAMISVDESDATLRDAREPAPLTLPPPQMMPATLGDVDESRYVFVEELGVGGVGRVVRARDTSIGRIVAMKTLRERTEEQPGVLERFTNEARVTAQLEHPNVVPVYDIGTLPNGQPYYTMRVIKRQSLQDVLASDDLRRQWPLVRLIGAFVQISRALSYAHRRGVLHRDIKPENILLGDFGEVYLADWGNAKDTGKPRRSSSEPPLLLADEGRDEDLDAQSGLSGTPGYIAPEQIRGDRLRIDHRADIFALGVVLYEILTGEHPFDAPTVLGVILATQTRVPRPPRAIVPSCPLLLEDLCLAMLQKDPGERPESADRVAAEAEAFLEGAKERARRQEEARRLCELAKVPVQKSRALVRERELLVAEAKRLLKDVKGYEPIERKRPAWLLEDQAAAVEQEQARMIAEAIDLYTKALAYDPEYTEARAGLADIYWSRALEAEGERRSAQKVYYETLVSEFDVGRYAALLRADAMLSIDSSVPGAVVLAYRYVETDRVLVPSEQRYVGRTPLREVRLPPGSYLLILKRPGYRDVRYPVQLARGAHYMAEVNLYTEEEVGEDFVYVPGGPFIAGGDLVAPESLPGGMHDVGDFAIARFPVTFRQYCAFLDAIDSTAALRRAPHDMRGSEGYAVRKGPSGLWEPVETIIEGEARRMFPVEEGHLWNVPVVLIDWFDAVAYCHWRNERANEGLRLPTELEWEKAARGTDGRVHPWGDHFDPTFCLMRASRPFLQQAEPIGTFPIDCSPYGVRDLAGGMREWVGDIVDERTWEEMLQDPEPSTETERGASPVRMARSGNWMATPEYCRSAVRSRFFGLTRGTGLSFRVAKSLGKR
jgi:formylglycine-generating enzyme required for sulfatase activity